MFMCEVELQLKTGNATGYNESISVGGGEKGSKPQAMERVTKAAILTLESAMLFVLEIL
jgi:hypothetical protein